MSVEESKIKYLIREYLIEEGLLRQKLPDSEKKLEFGFQFVFPPSPVGQNMFVLKPKQKKLEVLVKPRPAVNRINPKRIRQNRS